MLSQIIFANFGYIKAVTQYSQSLRDRTLGKAPRIANENFEADFIITLVLCSWGSSKSRSLLLLGAMAATALTTTNKHRRDFIWKESMGKLRTF